MDRAGLGRVSRENLDALDVGKCAAIVETIEAWIEKH